MVEMNCMFAASIFDSPWLLALIVIASAVANWLAKKRQEREAGPPPESEAPPSADQPRGEPNLEEALRRLLGGPSPSPPTVPPVIPRTTTPEPTSEPEWQDTPEFEPERTWMEEVREVREVRPEPLEAETRRQMPPPLPQPPLIQTRTTAVVVKPVTATRPPAAPSLTSAIEAGERPAAPHGFSGRTRRAARGDYWRNPKSAREAFVASLVFGPPKGLES